MPDGYEPTPTEKALENIQNFIYQHIVEEFDLLSAFVEPEGLNRRDKAYLKALKKEHNKLSRRLKGDETFPV